MANLKAVVFSLRNVFFVEEEKRFDEKKVEQLIKLIKHLANQGIKVILHSNDRWYMVQHGNITLAEYLSSITGERISYYNRSDFPAMPMKPKADAIPFILDKEKLEPNEIIYVGCNNNDWQACVNAKILFIKANWLKPDTEIPYGFSFDDIAALARFIDICCIKANTNNLISYTDRDLEFYTLSLYSTYKYQFQAYSASARSTAKRLTEDAEPDFWLMLFISKIYFSGLYREIQTIIAFPGHEVGYGNTVMDETLDIFAKCFRLSYLHDAIIRHTKSLKSQTARIHGNANLLGIYNHLNTLYLNRHPRKYGATVRLKGNPYKGKKILLVDDIATSGYSFDAAKLLLEKAGASKVICFSWLKTINTPLNVSTEALGKHYNVYSPVINAQEIYNDPKPKQIAFSAIMPSHEIGYEMTRLFTEFLQWNEDIL